MLVRWIRKNKNYRQTTCHDTSTSRFSGSVCRIALTPFIPPFLSSFHRVAYQPLLSVRVRECNVADQLKGTPRSLRRSRERLSSPMFCVCRSSHRIAFDILPLSLSLSLCYLPSLSIRQRSDRISRRRQESSSFCDRPTLTPTHRLSSFCPLIVSIKF